MQDTHEQDTHEHDSDLESRPIDDDSEDEQTTPSITFRDLGLSDSLLFAIGAMGWQYPSDVQAAAVPAALEGRDLIVQARTGSGKTGAFCIPIIQSLINPDLKEPQALVLCPTRELALQVATEAEKLAQESPIATLAVYGGAAMGPQVQAFKDGAQFISGSPGRVLDHLKRRTFKPDNVRVLVLDEADEMLSMGFLEEINAIIERLPEDRQMMLFSATIPKEIERLADRYQDDPVTLKLSEDFVGVREIDHIYYMISGGDRQQDLLRVLAYENPQAAIIFCNTRSDTAGVANFLAHQGFAAEGISSDLTQRERERVMKRMRDGELRFLVATDVAARGIDIDDVTHVINYTFPESADVYVHRTGRTGRAGKSGVAVSLVSPREIGSFYYLRLIHKISPEERHMPTAVELATRREAELYEQLVQRYGQRETTDEMRRLARRVLSTPDGEALIGHALVEALAKEKAEPTRSTTRRTRSRSSERSERRERDDRSDRSDRDDREDRPERAERAERAARSDGDGDSSEGDGRSRRRGRGERGERGERSDRGERGERSESRRGGRGRRSERRDDEPPRRRRSRSAIDINAETEPEAVITGDSDNVESFTTADGEVEYFATIDVDDSDASTERFEHEDDGADDDEGAANGDSEPRRRDMRRGSDGGEQEGMTRLYISIGRRHGVRTSELIDYLKAEGGVGSEQLGNVTLRDRHTFVNVDSAIVDDVIARISGKELKDRSLRVEPAKA